MISRQALLSGLQSLLRKLEADLLERSELAEIPEVGQALRAEFEKARSQNRTAQNFEDWRSDSITQVAAAWVLSCVFVRFLEDNELIDPPKLAGPGPRLNHARDEHTLFFQSKERAGLTDREYLLDVFAGLRDLKGGAAKDIFGGHNPVWELPNWLGPDAAGDLLKFFQKIDGNTGTLIHDFTDPNWDTRFLGDLYQDLSEAARKKYALLQTPEFVEEFILDRTLDPALDEFGLTPGAATVRERSGSLEPPESASSRARLEDVAWLEGGARLENRFKMIDPACGSGHFLLGAFPRILARWQKQEPGTNVRVLVQRSLDSIHGVDLNPYAVAIARFRLLLAALKECSVRKLIESPAFATNFACGDSLYHGVQRQMSLDEDWTDEAHYFRSEDAPELRRILKAGSFHCVVANPPYITPKDRAANEAYRSLYPKTCHMKYSLSVPFMERIFQLAVPAIEPRPLGSGSSGSVSSVNPSPRPSMGAGYTGQITSNSFMKREFGKKLIEDFIPSVDLTHVIDTAGAYIPGHGTPTVILFGRHRPPISRTLRTVMGIRGEPTTPDDPATGLVWSSIVAQVDQPGSQSKFVSVGESPRELFYKHPWSIGGGGAAELKEGLDNISSMRLGDNVTCIGFSAILGEDDAFTSPTGTDRIRELPTMLRRPLIEGDKVRDWALEWDSMSLFPYTADIELSDDQLIKDWFWPLRILMLNRADFSKRTYAECGRPYWEYHQIPVERNRIPLSIVFAEVATHNHFVLDRGAKVFKQTAPVIKLSPEASEDDHHSLLGLLNSSAACFWMKQVCHNKGSTVDQHGARQRTAPFEDFFAFNGTKIAQFPLPNGRGSNSEGDTTELEPRPSGSGLLDLTRRLDHLANQRGLSLPAMISRSSVLTRESIANAKATTNNLLAQMIFLQEELDWECYRLYELVDDDLTYQRAMSSEPLVPSRDREGAETLSVAREDHSLTVAAPGSGAAPGSSAAPGSNATQLPSGPTCLNDDWQGALRMVSKAETEPQAYFVTFTCYGTWLHGDPRGSVDRDHNVWQTPPLEPDEERERREFDLLKHSPVTLGAKQRAIVHRTIEEVCQHRGWRLHAVNVRTNHVHVVVTANRTGKRVRNDFKSYATRRMNEAGALPDACLRGPSEDRSLTVAALDEGTSSRETTSSRARQEADSSARHEAKSPDNPRELKVWTRGGSSRPLDTDNSFRRAIEYTLFEQGPSVTAPDQISTPAPDQIDTPSRAKTCSRAHQEAVLGVDDSVHEDRFLTGAARSYVAAPTLRLGQRAFEIVLARKVAAGETQTTWFERHGATPITEIPAEWPDDYRQLVERRIALIESDPNIRLIEQPEYKRRWNTEPWDSQLERALRDWLLDRLESYFDFDGRMSSRDRQGADSSGECVAKRRSLPDGRGSRTNIFEIALVSVARLADVARQDAEFQQVGELYRDDPAFDVQKLVEELVAAESVPLLPILRYKPSGLLKRRTWERAWDLQRQEDVIDARTKLPATDPQFLPEDAARDLKQKQVGDIPVPTKYDSKDFLDSNMWRLRGKLDVPKERWISFPHCEGDDGTLMLAWAGYDHLQQARAISSHYIDIQERLGGRDDPRLIPLLACLIELLPWLKQWHNELDPAFDGMRMGDYFEGFILEEARGLPKKQQSESGEETITTGWTIDEIKAWKPTTRTATRGRRKGNPKAK